MHSLISADTINDAISQNTVLLMDTFFSIGVNTHTRHQYQLIVIACMWIALKRDASAQQFSPRTMVGLTDNTYSITQFKCAVTNVHHTLLNFREVSFIGHFQFQLHAAQAALDCDCDCLASIRDCARSVHAVMLANFNWHMWPVLSDLSIYVALVEHGVNHQLVKTICELVSSVDYDRIQSLAFTHSIFSRGNDATNDVNDNTNTTNSN